MPRSSRTPRQGSAPQRVKAMVAGLSQLSSTRPSQSLSRPSQVSCAGVRTGTPLKSQVVSSLVSAWQR